VKIAQVAPLFESVPPKTYGGTERIVSYLTEELVRAGHDVTLFASGDSITQAKLISPCGRALRLAGKSGEHFAWHSLMVEEVYRRQNDFDLIHFHIDYQHFPVSRREHLPQITTLHGRLDLPELKEVYREYAEMPLVSISDRQRQPILHANWAGTVHHGLPLDLFSPSYRPGNYLAFLGRISHEKRVDRAIEIAQRAQMPLKIAAKIDENDRTYYERDVKHLLTSKGVEFLGEIHGEEKNHFLKNAFALLFPIDWPEPFGLVMIESLACGTPVIAWPHGSVPEVIESGRTGYIVNSIEAAIEAVGKIPALRRQECRSMFETRFSSERMAKDYLKIYEQLLRREQPRAVSV
jgi:glycosyltransferase involved in cell wall biosynthesis